jgi:hypothetical protein
MDDRTTMNERKCHSMGTVAIHPRCTPWLVATVGHGVYVLVGTLAATRHLGIIDLGGNAEELSFAAAVLMCALVLGAICGLPTAPLVIWIIQRSQGNVAWVIVAAGVLSGYLLGMAMSVEVRGITPLVVLLLLSVSVAATCIVISQAAPVKRAAHECPQCGYDLRGNPRGDCPECGWARTTMNE